MQKAYSNHVLLCPINTSVSTLRTIFSNNSDESRRINIVYHFLCFPSIISIERLLLKVLSCKCFPFLI